MVGTNKQYMNNQWTTSHYYKAGLLFVPW